MQTRVFQITLFKGFPNIPHIPPHYGTLMSTNEATRVATPENAPSWQETTCPREIWIAMEQNAPFSALSLCHIPLPLCDNSTKIAKFDGNKI